jgi:hypothetical protein
MLPVSNDTVLRVVRARACPRTEPLNVVGIDDWAFRRNHSYGTIVCDLERRRIVTLLPDREMATVKAWLAGHPDITVLSRDRGGGYSPETHHIVSAAVFAAMRPQSYLINHARGGIVDEAALLAALQSGGIAGAALDVFATEPLPTDHPFWSMENVIITCHQAATHEGTVQANLPTITENIRKFINGDIVGMRNVVRPARSG